MTKATPEQLCIAINDMDNMAQGAFSEIATFAKLALASLETPEAYINLEGMAYVLSAIRGKALDAENTINAMAEEVGCNYKDQAMRRRLDAQRKAAETTTGGRA